MIVFVQQGMCDDLGQVARAQRGSRVMLQTSRMGKDYESVDTGGEDGLGAAIRRTLAAKQASMSLVVDT